MAALDDAMLDTLERWLATGVVSLLCIGEGTNEIHRITMAGHVVARGRPST